MTVVWTVLVPLAQKVPPANKVKAGWVAFWIILALLIAVALLGWSLNTQLKRVNFVEEPEEAEETADTPVSEGDGRGESAPDRDDPGTPQPPPAP